MPSWPRSPSRRLPVGAKILSVQDQGGTLCLWALIDPERAWTHVHLRILGTGHPIDPEEIEGLVYLGTALQGRFVWHVFRLKGAPFDDDSNA